MSEEVFTPEPNVEVSRDSAIERKLIAEYLLSKGYRLSDLKALPEELSKSLMRDACLYAALKLAEIEARSKFRRKIERPD